MKGVKEQFPALQKSIHGHPFIYLDTAATAMKPLAVIEAMDLFYREEYGTVHRAVYTSSVQSTALYASVREKARAFLGAKSSEEIIFTKGTTEAVNLVAFSFGEAFVFPGDEIIVTEMEHHANLIPWQQLCKRKGATLRICPIDEKGNLRLDILEELLSSRTKLIALCHISNVTGAINPIRKVKELASRVGAKVFVDGAQAAPHMSIDVRALGADFYVFSGHKAFGPTGIGILYGLYELLVEMPPYQFGGDMIEEVTYTDASFRKPPLRFEAGTPPIAEVIGLGAALDWIVATGREEIAAWELYLAKKTRHALSEIPGLRFLGEPDEFGGLVSFVMEGVHTLDLATLLDSRGIAARSGHLCAQPLMKRFRVRSALRFSFAPYTTEAEVETACFALQELSMLLI